MTPLTRLLALAAALVLGAHGLGGPASAQIPAMGAISNKNVHSEGNQSNLGGNALDFFERRLANGTIKRYAVAATMGNGFDILDITDPLSPTTVSRYASPGINYHPWVQVNGPRNIVAISIEDPGRSPAHGGADGIEFVDITDLSAPVQLGIAEGLGGKRMSSVTGVRGPHTIRRIGPNHIYTTLPTYIIDYSNPRQPVNLGEEDVPGLGLLCGHEFAPDPNIPGRTYVGICGTGTVGRWAILDTTDPANPRLIHEHLDNTVQYAHEVFPSPDSSFVAISDFRSGPAGGQSYTRCPGGGMHLYDISGTYKPGASLTNPIKMGTWFAPFTGASEDPNGTSSNWGTCNLHSLQFQPERNIMTVGLYMGGSWILDPSAPTVPGGDLYKPEYDGTLGKTTWGNTTGNFVAEGDLVNAAQWMPFDIPVARDHYFTNGMFRGLDILHYAGPMPAKLARLRVNASAPGGVVSGILDRYAVLTYEGWVNKPLAGKTVEIRSGGTTLTATTAADGSFSANLGLAPGTHTVTVTWAGDDVFGASSLSRQVTA